MPFLRVPISRSLRLLFSSFLRHRISLRALYSATGQARWLAACFPLFVDQEPFSIQ